MQTLNVFNNSIVSKVYNLLSSAVSSRREKGQRFTVVKYESNAVDIFIFLHSMVNRCKNPEITLWPDLNLTVGLDTNFS